MDKHARKIRERIRSHPAGGDWRSASEGLAQHPAPRADHSASFHAAAAGELLDREGPSAALAEVELGLSLVRRDPGARAALLAERSGYLLALDDIPRALESARDAERLVPVGAPDGLHREIAARLVAARSVALDDALDARAARTTVQAALQGQACAAPAAATALAAWALTRGEASYAQHLAQSAVESATETGQRWYAAEARTIRWVASTIVGIPQEPPQLDTLPAEARAPRIVAGVESYLVGLGVDRHLPASSSAGGADETIEGADATTVWNLGAQLARAEAASLGGARREALRWREWVEALPASVELAVGWPASKRRVEGLLHARGGDFADAASALAEARRWALGHDAPFEAAAAALQLANVLSVAPEAHPRASWMELREQGSAEAAALGMHEASLTHAAASAAGSGKFDAVPPPLTAREVEVLTAFATGLTYNEVASDLGVSPRTVQTHAYNAYAKLGVHNKQSAIRRAEELRLI